MPNSSLEAEAGDIVQLRSGGPDMTIHSKLDNGFYFCQWFPYDNRTQICEASFPPTSLITTPNERPTRGYQPFGARGNRSYAEV